MVQRWLMHLLLAINYYIISRTLSPSPSLFLTLAAKLILLSKYHRFAATIAHFKLFPSNIQATCLAYLSMQNILHVLYSRVQYSKLHISLAHPITSYHYNHHNKSQHDEIIQVRACVCVCMYVKELALSLSHTHTHT